MPPNPGELCPGSSRVVVVETSTMTVVLGSPVVMVKLAGNEVPGAVTTTPVVP
jgi:hypothetical protein